MATLFAVGLILNVARGGTARRRAARRPPALANCASSRAGARPRAKGADRAVPGTPRVVVAAGGTAGHVVPAMAVADELRASGAEVSFLGTRERIEAELVPAAGYEIDFVKVRGIDRRNPLQRGRGPRSRRWRAVGAARAGAAPARGRRGDGRRRLRRRPGRAGGGADADAAGPDRGRQPPRPRQPPAGAAGAAGLPRLPDRGPGGGAATWSPGGRCRRRCWQADRGGGAGAVRDRRGRPLPAGRRRQPGRPLDQPRRASRPSPSARARDFHVLHLAGTPRLRRARARGSPPPRTPSATRCSPTSPTSATRSPPADLVLARSGGSIFEVAAAGRPAILVPYPARDRRPPERQRRAGWREAGAAIVIADAELSAERLRGRGRRRCSATTARLEAMAAASRGAGQARRRRAGSPTRSWRRPADERLERAPAALHRRSAAPG